MSWLIPSVVATMSGTAILTFCFYYVYQQDQEKYLKVWALGWAIYFTRFIFLLLIIFIGNSKFLLICNQLASLVSGIFILYGTHLFIGKNFPKILFYLTFLSILWIFISILGNYSFLLMSLPTFSFLALIYIWTGYVFLQYSKTELKEGVIVGISFILWGIHKANYPFLKPVIWFAPWGYLIAAILEFTTAIGLLIIYFRKTSNKLAKSEERYKLAMKFANDGLFDWNLETNEIYYSPGWKRLLGYEDHEIPNEFSEWERLTAPDDVKSSWAMMNELLEGKIGRFVKEFKMLHKDGHWVDILSRANVIYNENGKAARVVGTHVDISERKQSEEALRKGEEQLRTIFKAANEVSFIITDAKDPEPTVLEFSPGAEKLFGFKRSEMIGKTVSILHLPEDVQNFPEAHQKMREGQKGFSGETILVRKSGEKFSALFSTYPLLNKDGSMYAALGVSIDISKQKKLEDQLKHTQKMEAIGTLAGGIAHDFNNMLGVISGNVSYLLNLYKDDNALVEVLSDIDEGVLNSQKLTQQLLTFAKGGAPIKKIANINHIVEESAKFVTRGAKAKCNFNLTQDLWSTEVDTGQLNQVISNLVINANQAMPNGGIITIRTENTSINTSMTIPLPAGSYVKIIIEDQGIGISEKHLPNIFDPYFSTKQAGSGLGLATTYSIIKRHGGHIAVDSKLDKGTTFTIFLPATTKESEPIQPKELSAHSGQGKILVMDDEAPVLKVSKRILTSMGYEVEFAKDGYEAIKKYKQEYSSGNSFDLVILDLTVPGSMGGSETIPKLLKIDSQAKVAVSSGYSNDPIMANYEDYGVAGIIPKPYRQSQMAELLNKILGEKE